MKKRLIPIIAAVTALALGGCTAAHTQVLPIDFAAAKMVAVEAAGVEANTVVLEESDLKEKGGQKYYDIEFVVDGVEYEYDIDAVTGKILDSNAPVKQNAPDSQVGTEKEPSKIENNNVSKTENVKASAKEETKPAAKEEVKKEESKPAADKETKTETAATPIGEAQAKVIAVAHAGLAESNVTFVQVEMDNDDGRKVYEIEFYSKDGTEYDYEIDIYTGAVVSVDKDAENYTKPAVKEETKKEETKPAAKEEVKKEESKTTIGASQAKAIALAQVPGATEADITEFETDKDDGRVSYEGTIRYKGMEYDFEIDGYSGAIREWDAEKDD